MEIRMIKKLTIKNLAKIKSFEFDNFGNINLCNFSFTQSPIYGLFIFCKITMKNRIPSFRDYVFF